jgi:putative pyoverdin transport system ATP-binding/permease protein
MVRARTERMKIVFLLLRYSKAVAGLATIASIANGAASIGIIALINQALSNHLLSSPRLIWSFAGLCLVLPVTRFASEFMLTQMAQRAAFDLRLDLSRRILAAPLRDLEKTGGPRLVAALTEDVNSITTGLVQLPSYSVQITIVIGCLVYLGWLSLTALSVIVIYLTLALLTSQLFLKRAVQRMKLARKDQDTLFERFRALIDGAKELKLHQDRRLDFLDNAIEPAVESLRKNSVVGSAIYSVSNSWALFLTFALLGLLIFGLPALGWIEPKVLVGYALALLYIIMNIGVLFSMPPILGRANVALNNIESLGLPMAEAVEDTSLSGSSPVSEWRSLDLVDVSHTYQIDNGPEHFSLGPLSLNLSPGELVFLIGGNGSGKTTLAKLLTGLYSPESGEVQLDGATITKDNIAFYRQHFSAVFSDFYLFENLVGPETRELDSKARGYLARLQLDKSVSVENGRMSTTKLSQGQRKRLALLGSYLEDRPIYIFDEWAADQDPAFKEVFYLELLPELRGRGKTLIVISHDDRYYHLADRIIKLDYGQMASDTRDLAGRTESAEVAAHSGD